MDYIKTFGFGRDKGLYLKNCGECFAYIDEKIKHFSEYKNFSSKKEWIDLFQEILEIIEFDLETAIFDFSEVNNIVGFSDRERKKQMVLYYDIVYVLGTICYNVFDVGDNRLSLVEGGGKAAINTGEMLKAAYYELHSIKQKNSQQPAYGATLILATLFESEIKLKFKNISARECLKKIQLKMSQGEVADMTKSDIELLNYLNSNYYINFDNVVTSKYDNIVATTNLMVDLFEKNNCMGLIDNSKRLFLNKMTLNEMLNNKYFKSICVEPFYRIVCYLFNVEHLNLRNNLAHCNYTYMNYYLISVTALLYILHYMVVHDYYIK